MENRRLPPYGALLKSYIATNLPRTFPLFIYCGNNAWESAKAMLGEGKLCLILPKEADFNDFAWPVAGFKVILDDGGDISNIILKEFAYTLLVREKAQFVLINSESNVEYYRS